MRFYPPEGCPQLPVNNTDNFMSAFVLPLGAQFCVAGESISMAMLLKALNHLRAGVGTPPCMTDVQLTAYVSDESGQFCSGAVAQWWEGESELVRRIEFSFREGRAWAITVHPTDPEIYNREFLAEIPDDTALDNVCETVLRALEDVDAIEWPEL